MTREPPSPGPEGPPSPAPPGPSLGARAVSGLTWGALGAAANVLFQVGFTAAMARLLAPADFGLLAMCSLSLRLFSYVSQLGLGPALVQRERLGDQDVRLALGITWVISSVAALGVVATAPLLGWFFRSPEVVPLVQVLSLNLLLTGLGAVPTALLRRGLRFRELALVETGSYALGFGAVAVAAGAAGAGPWSLVAATLGQSAVALAGAAALVRLPLRPTLRGDRAALLGYGARHSLITVLEFLGANLDAALVGRLLGEVTLGVYNRALVLTNQPVERAAGILARVLFPLLATVQAERRKVGAVFLLGLAAIGLFAGAVSAGLAAAAGDVVRLLLGPGWGEAAGVVEVLAFSVPLMFMSNVAGVVCDALALLHFKLRVQAFGLAALAALMAALYPLGLRGIALAILVGEALRLAVYLRFLARELQCARGDLARVLLGAGLGAALAWAACAGAGRLAAAAHLAPATTVLLEVAGGAAALVLGAGLTLRLLDGTEPARLAEASLPGWQRLRTRLRLVAAW